MVDEAASENIGDVNIGDTIGDVKAASKNIIFDLRKPGQIFSNGCKVLRNFKCFFIS